MARNQRRAGPAHDRLPPGGALFPARLEWADIARDKEATAGSDEAERVFRNTVLGETGSRPARLRTGSGWPTGARRWMPGTVPAGALFLTAGADVQKDRIEVDVWAGGRGLESWLVEHVVIPHGPGDRQAWDALDRLLGRTWPHDRGAAMRLARLAIDTGQETSAIYAWSRRADFAQVAAREGRRGPSTGRARWRGRPMSMSARAASGSVAAPGSGRSRSRPSRRRPTGSCVWSARAQRSRPAPCTCRSGSMPSG